MLRMGSTPRKEHAMSKVVAIMSMSLDGYVADLNDGVAEVFDWYFSAGLLDEIHVDIAAVFLGFGIRLFDHLAGTPIVLGNPAVTPGFSVTHLRYPVRTT